MRFRKLPSIFEFADQNTEIQDQFINKCLSNHLRRRLLQKPNLTLEKVVEKVQAKKLVEKQSIIMQTGRSVG